MPAKPVPTVNELCLFGEALIMLAISSLAVRFCPFPWIVRSAAWGRGEARRSADASAISQAVKRASRRLPWRTLCFQEGLAAQWMLRRRGEPAELHYGVRNKESLSAHVWVSLHGNTVIGEEQSDPHVRVATFPARVVDA